MRQRVWAWVVMTVVGQQASAFNFLPEHPEVFRGAPGSKFGYSVALWNDSTGMKRVAVGAPQENQTTWWGENLPLGNVHYCEPNYGGGGGGGGADGRCLSHRGLPLPEANQDVKEIYDHILRSQGVGMGQTVMAERGGNRAVVCAPLYPYSNSHRIAKNDGLCFLLTNMTADSEAMGFPNHHAFNNSLMGFSAAFAQGNEGTVLVLGGPNALQGNGLFYNQPVGYKGGLSVSTLQMTKTLSDANEAWAIAVGKFSGSQGGVTLAASSPKFDIYTGKVSFYPLDIKPEGKPLYTIIEKDMEIGAMFGYAMISTDVDGDGTTDLLVGAPFSTDPTSKYPDAGKVFVYYAPLTKDPLRNRTKVITVKEAWARFGTSLAALGDVDLDGYEDVAVGAPYGGEDGAGVVYIYNGGENGLHINKPKVIAASKYLVGSRGFGFSLAGGLDMDGNGYTDLAVGSLHSDTAVLLRSSPVVKLKGQIYFNPSPIVVEDSKKCIVDFAGYRKMRAICFDLIANFTYTSDATFNNLKFNFIFNLSNKNGTPSYGFSHHNGKTTTQKSFLRTNEYSNTLAVQVFIQRSRANINLLLDASVMVSIESYSSGPLLTSTSASAPTPMTPVLDVFTPSTYFASTILTCKNKSTCFTKPDLAIFGSGPPVILGDSNMRVQLDVTLEVRTDPAYGIEVSVKLPDKLTFHTVTGDSLVPECRKEIDKTNVICKFIELDADEKVEFALTFTYEPSELFDVPDLQFRMSVKNDVNSDTDKTNNRASVKVRVKKEAALYPRGFSYPEGTTVTVNQTATEKELKQALEDPSTTFPVDYLGPHIEHSFSLNNRGPSDVEGAKLVFHIPLFWGEERLTYFMEQPKSSHQVTCSSVPINPLRLEPPRSPVFGYDADSTTNTTTTTASSVTFKKTTEADVAHRLQKRDLQDPALSLTTDSSYFTSSSSSDPSTSTFPSSFQWTTDPADYFSTTSDPMSSNAIDSRSALECMSVECRVVCNVAMIKADESVNVTFSSYLVTATVSKLGFRKVLLRTWVTAEVNQSGSTIINPTLPATTEVFLLRPPEQGFSALPLWVLILAIVISILLILIIILILHKAGFFKRNRPPIPPNRESRLQPNDTNERMEDCS